MRNTLLLAATMGALLGTAALAAPNPTKDVPRGHWAYGAIQAAVDAGVLKGFPDGTFQGGKLINRYQMASIVKRILEALATGGGARAAGMSTEQIRNLEAVTVEFGDELALLGTRVSTLEEAYYEIDDKVSAMKRGRGGDGTLKNAFSGFVSVGFVATDDGTGTSGLGTQTRFIGNAVDQAFFTIPQASIALDHQINEGLGLHVQYDYSTDAASSGAGGIGGNGVGLNEAYLVVDELFGEVGGKFGGFALPLQSWEVDGPFRTLSKTITPSVVNTAFEAIRVVGVELSQFRDMPRHFRWRLGVFDGGDTALGAGGINNYFSRMNDSLGLGLLTGTASLDSSAGAYLDLESPDDPGRRWGWRFSIFDLGGDIGPAATNTATIERNGVQFGHWFRRDRLLVQTQLSKVETQSGTAGGGANDTDSVAWYLLFNYKLNTAKPSSVTLRYDDFENELDVPGGAANDGDAVTIAYNRELSENSVFQFEYLFIDHETRAGGTTDVDDDLLQFRYKVWF